jgi:uncharacterized membrane protein
MSTKLTTILSLILISAALIAGALFWNQLPDPMPSHWNAAGEINGYMPKFWGIWLMPLMTLGITLLLALVPSIDPLKANIEKFRGFYNFFIIGFVIYMIYIYALTLAAALGIKFNMSYMMLPAMGLLFVALSFLIKNAKRNFFIGIRTPWTLSNDDVWDKTHALGAQSFRIGGLIAMISILFGERGFWLFMIAILLATFVPVVYSYILWRKLQK